jgi:hypothetical protein
LELFALKPFRLPLSLVVYDESEEGVNEATELKDSIDLTFLTSASSSSATPEPVKKRLFKKIVSQLNLLSPRYEKGASVADTSNTVNLIFDRTKEKYVSVFKKIPEASSLERNLGTGCGVEFSLQNEVVASHLGNLISDRKIVPSVEIVTVQGQKGTMHEFVNGRSLPTDLQMKKLREDVSSLEIQLADVDSEQKESVSLKHKQAVEELSETEKTLAAFRNPESPQFGLQLQGIGALHILTVSKDVNLGNLMMTPDGTPMSIDYNELAPPKFSQGIKPPCWMACEAASVPYAGNPKLNAVTWPQIKSKVESIEGHSSEGLSVIKTGHILLKTGIERGLSLNEMAYFLIGNQIFPGAPRAPSPIKHFHDSCSDESELRSELIQAMDHLRGTILPKYPGDYSTLSGVDREARAEKIALELEAYCSNQADLNQESYGDV